MQPTPATRASRTARTITQGIDIGGNDRATQHRGQSGTSVGYLRVPERIHFLSSRAGCRTQRAQEIALGGCPLVARNIRERVAIALMACSLIVASVLGVMTVLAFQQGGFGGVRPSGPVSGAAPPAGAAARP